MDEFTLTLLLRPRDMVTMDCFNKPALVKFFALSKTGDYFRQLVLRNPVQMLMAIYNLALNESAYHYKKAK